MSGTRRIVSSSFVLSFVCPSVPLPMMASIISYEEVVKIVTDVYGFNDIHKIRGLGSCQDINFRIDVKQPNEGSNEIKSYILKISNLDTTMEYIQFQNSILMHLNSVKGNKSNLQFPNLVSTINDNEFITSWKIGEDTYFIRCFTFVHGIILSDCGYLSLDVYEKLGALCYQVDNLLKGVDIPDAEEFLSKESNESGNDKQWDMQFALKNLEQYISILVPTPSLDVMMMHSLLRQAYHCQYLIERYLPYLSKQVIHGDLAYYNLVAAAADVITPSAGQSTGVIYGRPTITGVIDFGDCTYSWLIGELCVAITPLLVTDDQDPVEITCAVLRGFLSASAVGNTVALTDGEVFSLWPLIIQRAIMLNIFIAYQLQVDPANQYCAKELVLNRRLLEKVLAVPMVYAQTSLHHVLLKVSRPELLVPPTQLPVSMLALEGLTSLIHIDPSVTSALFQERFWHENIAREDVLRIGECAYDLAGIINRVWIAVSSEGISNKKSASGLMLAYGVPQFYRTMPLCHSNPRTIPLGVTFFLNQLMLPAMWFKMRSNGRICEVPNLKTNDTSSTNSTSPYDPFLEMSLSISSEIRLIRIENCPYDILLRAESKLTMVEKFSRPTKMQKTKGSDVSWEPLEAGDKIIIKACSSGSLGSPLVHLQMVSRSLAELLIDPSGAPQLPPLYCSSTEFETWRTLCPDPCLFLQVPGGKCQYDGNTFQAIDSPDHGVTQGFSDTLTTVVANCTSSLQSRKQYAANAQEYYYSNTGIPPFIERGFKQYLFDISGRSYLDMVNNVAIVGHSREAIKSAVQKQMTLLNTNSRFVYTSFGEFCEQVVSKLSHIAPNHWSTTTGWRVSDDDNGSANKTATTATSSSKSKESIKNHWQVFVVNSGSEAVDLALRIARTVVTERRRYLQGVNCTDIDSTTTDKVPYELQRHTLCFGGGYHGVTTSSDEVSTTLNDNPRSLDSRPHWIHLLPLPNMYRGKWRCGSYGRSVDINMETALILKQERVNLGRQYAETVAETLDELKMAGKSPSAFICEPLVGNAGGVELPLGYLKRVYSAVRAHGGLCICDEVQVGYGRLGTHFWGFEEHGVVPDIITMAKAAGNGHPFGYVVTSLEIAESFRQAENSFFSSSGGCPVSCVTGTHVLRLLDQEHLQDNARSVGKYLHSRLLDLKQRHEKIIGCIHGHGLYQGIELVRGGSADSPAPSEMTQAICNRLLSLGIICHGTGDYSNILKVKPPLCFTRADAEFFVTALDSILSTGW